jgi:ribose transport system substrate-binding protein
MKKIKVLAFVVALCMLLGAFVGCAATETEASSTAPESQAEVSESASSEETAMEEASGEAAEGSHYQFDVYTASSENLTTAGPDGEKTCSPSDLSLTDEEIQKLKDGNFKVAFCYHELEDMCNNSKLAAAKEQCENWGIEVVATTNADFSIEQQISDIESVLALKPDVIFVMPIDADAIVSTIKKANEAGSKVVFMEMHANGLEAGTDYIGTVANDFYGVGVGCAHMLAEGIGYEGTVAMCYYDAAFYATNQRDDGFKATMAEYYPDIDIVMEIGFTDQNDTASQGDAIFTQYPDVDGVYASWDIPLEGIISAAKVAGRTDLVCATPDLSDNTARRMAERDMVVGSAAPQSYLCGQVEVTMAAYSMLGKELPAYYCSVPAQYIMRDNLAEAYKNMYNEDLPEEVQEILDSNP